VEKDITDRIEAILKEYALSPSGFSDLIQVQRSAMSHIFSRRNRPSLDVIQKVLKQFPEINSHWLLTGIGKMKQLNLFDEEDGKGNLKKTDKVTSRERVPFSEINPIPVSESTQRESTVYKDPVPLPRDFQRDPTISDNGFLTVPPDQLPVLKAPPAKETDPVSSQGVYNKPQEAVRFFPPEQFDKPSGSGNDQWKEEAKKESLPPVREKSKEKEIERIIIFYKDKTFSTYTPE
jgi:hypothetical protein